MPDNAHEAFAVKTLPDGRRIDVTPMTYGKGRLHITAQPEDLWYTDEWCYESYTVAVVAAINWDGQDEPQHWFRHPDTGRRRPNGDPTQEHIQH